MAESVERSVKYFDVAPSYGKGEAQQQMGLALRFYRNNSFLACKTGKRDAVGAKEELERSLKEPYADRFDLYQFHGVSKMEDVEQIMAPGGALETFVEAREQRKVCYIGFSAHSEEAALTLLDQFEFDSVLYPINYVNYAQGHFGPRLVERAKEKGIARLALKALAYRKRDEGEEKLCQKCWYQPLTDRERIRLALRFTLSEDITATIFPGDEELYRIVPEMAHDLEPMTLGEREDLLASTEGVTPIMSA